MGTTAWMQEVEQRMEQLPRGSSRNPSYPITLYDGFALLYPSYRAMLFTI